MRAKRAVSPLLFLATLLALPACNKPAEQEPAPEAAAIIQVSTADLATELFQDKIDWSGYSEVRATLAMDLLEPGNGLGEYGGDTVYHSREFAWLAHIDFAPGAYFRHPVRYGLLSFTDPTTKFFDAARLPTVNGVPVWPSLSEFATSAHVVHSNCWLDREPNLSAERAAQLQFINWPPRMATDHCPNQRRGYALLLHNLPDLETSPETLANLENMANALAANGYAVAEFRSDTPDGERVRYLNIGAQQGAGLYQLSNYINIHRDFNDCCEEFLVYITGETSLESIGSKKTAFLDLPFAYRGANNSRVAKSALYAEDLAAYFDDLKTCHLNVVIDSNNAAGFVDDLLRIRQTESVIASCQLGEYTYSAAFDTLAGGAFIDPYATADGETGSEFTSSLAKGIFDRAAEREAEDDPAQAHTLAKLGFDAVTRYDLSLLAGQTTPTARGRIMNSGCSCGIDSIAKL